MGPEIKHAHILLWFAIFLGGRRRRRRRRRRLSSCTAQIFFELKCICLFFLGANNLVLPISSESIKSVALSQLPTDKAMVNTRLNNNQNKGRQRKKVHLTSKQHTGEKIRFPGQKWRSSYQIKRKKMKTNAFIMALNVRKRDFLFYFTQIWLHFVFCLISKHRKRLKSEWRNEDVCAHIQCYSPK